MAELCEFSGIIPCSNLCSLLDSFDKLANFGTSMSLLLLSLAVMAFCTAWASAIVSVYAFMVFLHSFGGSSSYCTGESVSFFKQSHLNHQLLALCNNKENVRLIQK